MTMVNMTKDLAERPEGSPEDDLVDAKVMLSDEIKHHVEEARSLPAGRTLGRADGEENAAALLLRCAVILCLRSLATAAPRELYLASRYNALLEGDKSEMLRKDFARASNAQTFFEATFA